MTEINPHQTDLVRTLILNKVKAKGYPDAVMTEYWVKFDDEIEIRCEVQRKREGKSYSSNRTGPIFVSVGCYGNTKLFHTKKGHIDIDAIADFIVRSGEGQRASNKNTRLHAEQRVLGDKFLKEAEKKHGQNVLTAKVRTSYDKFDFYVEVGAVTPEQLHELYDAVKRIKGI